MLHISMPVDCDQCGAEVACIEFTAARTPEEAARLMAHLITEMMPSTIDKVARHLIAHHANPILAPKANVVVCNHCEATIGVTAAANHGSIAAEYARHLSRHHFDMLLAEHLENVEAVGVSPVLQN